MKSSILVGIPCLTGPEHCAKAIQSVIVCEEVDVLLIDNGATIEVKDVLLHFERIFPSCHVIHNNSNQFVNPAWNQILEVFLTGSWSRLCIMNSDLIMRQGWDDVVRNRWAVDPDEILLPIINEPGKDGTEVMDAQYVTEGTPGVFITLNRTQAKLVYPIHKGIKVWYGDNWIYEGLRNRGYKTVIPQNLCASHEWSSTVSVVPGIHQIIEEDKVAWGKIKHLI